MNFEELLLLLKTANTVEEIDEYRDQIAEMIPKVRIMFDYDQNNSAHQYDLWMHCLHTVMNLERNMDDDMLYLAALLHDIGKPDCQVAGKKEDDTNMHYYGHPERSAQIVQDEILDALSKKEIELLPEDQRRLVYYVRYHDDRVSLRMKHLRRHLKMVGLEEFKKLMLLQVADAKAHVMIPIVAKRIEICEKLSGSYADYLQEQILAGK
jgi:hypothetical protein